MGQEQDKTEREQALILLKAMQNDVDFHIEMLSAKALSRLALQRIPSMRRYLRAAGESGEEVTRLGGRINRVVEAPNVEVISDGLMFGTTALAVYDFIRIPFIYMYAYIIGEKLPFSLNTKARWAFSAIILAITITALVIPASAPIIAFLAAGAAFGGGIIETAKALYDRSKLRKQLLQVNKAIDASQQDLDLIKAEASKLEIELLHADNTDNAEIYKKIALLKDNFDYHMNQLEGLKTLKTQQVHLKQQINQLNTLTLLDKSVKIIWGALTIIGVVTAVSFPPIGLGILLATAAISASYFFTRLSTPLFKKINDWIHSKPIVDKKDSPADDPLNNEIDLLKKDDKATSENNHSTSTALKELLMDVKPAHTLNSDISKPHQYKKRYLNELFTYELGGMPKVTENTDEKSLSKAKTTDEYEQNTVNMKKIIKESDANPDTEENTNSPH